MEDNLDLNSVKQQLQIVKGQLQELNSSKDEITSSIEKKTVRGIKKWIYKWIGGGILSLVLMYFSIYFSVTRNATNYITNSIKDKFAEPLITQTLNEVAKNEAKKIISDSLNPEISKATTLINEKIELFDKDIQEFKKQYDIELKNLAKEVGYLRNRNDILRLGDEAITTGDYASYKKLEDIYKTTKDNDTKMAVSSEALRIKNQIATTTRIKGVQVIYTDEQSKKQFIDKDIPTEALIQGLREAEPWEYRARIAQLLGNRREKQVPEALLDAIKNDSNLMVRKEALDSFESVTGFVSPDVLNYELAKQWWDKNKVKVEEKLINLQTIAEVVHKKSGN